MKDISIHDFENIAIGQTEDPVGGTGCTVFLSRTGMPAGIDIRGGGPATRDVFSLDPLSTAQVIHGVVLGGGSAFGLDAAGGVMQYLEEQGIGYEVGPTRVPLVCQANLFDLGVGDPKARPDKDMGYRACELAMDGGNYRDGCFGAGCGATVGKLYSIGRCMKSGIGSYAVQLGELKVGAVVALNSFGDVYDHKSGRQIAGLLSEDGTGIISTLDEMVKSIRPVENKFTGNTAIAVVLTNALFEKSRLCKIASLAQDGYARSIRPVHTSADGDSIFALSLGEVIADMDLVGTLAAEVVSEAITRAVYSAESAYGRPAHKDLFRD